MARLGNLSLNHHASARAPQPPPRSLLSVYRRLVRDRYGDAGFVRWSRLPALPRARIRLPITADSCEKLQ